MEKNAKEVAMQQPTKENEPRKIPFGKPAIIGNYKLYQTKLRLNKKETISAIVISDLGGLWKVQIPEKYLMYRAITDLFGSGDDRDIEILFSFITNFNFCTSISHGHFQDFLILSVYGYRHPEVLEKGYEPEDKKFLSYAEFMNRVIGCVDGYKEFVENERKEQERQKKEIEKAAEEAKLKGQLKK